MEDVHLVFTEELTDRSSTYCEVGPNGEVRLPLSALWNLMSNIGEMEATLLNVALPLSERGYDVLWWVYSAGHIIKLGLDDAGIKLPRLIAGCKRS